MRQLCIGPGKDRLPGFENLDIRPGKGIDYVADARRLTLPDNIFDLVYASHVIEHIPWFETASTLAEWHRIIKPGGKIEVWTVDAYKVAKALICYEETEQRPEADNFKRYGADRDPYLWCAGRIFAYGPDNDPNWHRAMFTPMQLAQALTRAGFIAIKRLDKPRGKDHGWINLGLEGTKET